MFPNKTMYELSTSVNKLSRLIADYLQREMFRSGHREYHPTTGYILIPLLETEGLTLSDIAKHLHMKAPTITVIANRLEKKGLIRRERGKSDRRHVLLFLTKSGRDVARRINSIQKRAVQEMLAGLSLDSITSTKSTIDKIIDNVNGTIN